MKDKDLERLAAGMAAARDDAAVVNEKLDALIAVLVENQRRAIEAGLLPKITDEERRFASESSLMCIAVLALSSKMHERHEAAPLAGIARALASMCIAQGMPRKALMQALNDAMNPTFATITPEVQSVTKAMRRPQ